MIWAIALWGVLIVLALWAQKDGIDKNMKGA